MPYCPHCSQPMKLVSMSRLLGRSCPTLLEFYCASCDHEETKKIAQQPHKAVLAKAYIATAIGSRLTGPFTVIVARSELIDFERPRKTDSTFAF